MGAGAAPAKGDPAVEFVGYGEAIELLKEQGIEETEDGDGRVSLQLIAGDEVRQLHLTCRDSECEPRDGAAVVTVERDQLPKAVDNIIQKLHLSQMLLIPVSKWRKVFDAVAFSMVDNQDWQAVDTAATVELNTRDPLLCEPGDFHTVNALVKALFSDAESVEQGLMITTTTAPVMVEIVPQGAVRISVGNAVLADELEATLHG